MSEARDARRRFLPLCPGAGAMPACCFHEGATRRTMCLTLRHVLRILLMRRLTCASAMARRWNAAHAGGAVRQHPVLGVIPHVHDGE